MSPKAHVIQGVISGAALYPVLGEGAIPFALSIILIDVDHIFEYAFNTRDTSLKGFFTFYRILFKNIDKNYLGLSVFHTVEMYLLLLVLARWFPMMYLILLGCVFHHLFDTLLLIKQGVPFARAFSIVEYLVRRKSHATSLREVLRHENVDVEGIPDLENWLKRWGMNKELSEKTVCSIR